MNVLKHKGPFVVVLIVLILAFGEVTKQQSNFTTQQKKSEVQTHQLEKQQELIKQIVSENCIQTQTDWDLNLAQNLAAAQPSKLSSAAVNDPALKAQVQTANNRKKKTLEKLTTKQGPRPVCKRITP